MNKSYVFLIGILIVLAVAVGSFALYRSTINKTVAPVLKTSPIDNNLPTVKSPPPQISEEEQIAKNNTLPLTITVPQNGAQVTSPKLTLTGNTAPNSDVSVNDKDLKADTIGKFSTVLTLEEGDNYILVVASNENGASEWQGTITYAPSQ